MTDNINENETPSITKGDKSHDIDLGLFPEEAIGGSLPKGKEFVLASESEGEPVAFPLHLFPQEIRKFATESARSSLTNEKLTALLSLGVVSASLGAGLEVHTNIAPLRANLFTLIPAPSGTGKDLALNLAKDPISKIDRERFQSFINDALPSLRADLKLAQRSIQAMEKDKSVGIEDFRAKEKEIAEIERLMDAEPNLTIDDTTREALTKVLATQTGEATSLISSEGRAILSNIKGRYSNGENDADLYCKAHSGGEIKPSRMGRKTTPVKNPCLSSLLLTQPDNLEDVLNDAKMSLTGYLPRCLMLDPKLTMKKMPKGHKPFDEAVGCEWGRLITAFVESFRDMPSGEPVAVLASERVIEQFRAYQNETADRVHDDLRDVASFAARWVENAWKIALCFHAVNHREQAGDHVLSEETAGKAIELMKYLSGEQLAIIAPVRFKAVNERVGKLIELLSESDGEITLRILAHNHGFDKQEVEKLASHSRKIEVRKHQPVGGGRPSFSLILKKK